jgi:protein ImuB
MSTPAELYAAVYAKEFPAQAMLRARPELRGRPCVVMDGRAPLQYAFSLNGRARRLGIAHGMSRAEIEIYPAAAILERSPAEEADARAAALACAASFSPRVEERRAERAFLFVLDMAGTGNLFGPPEEMAKMLKTRLGDLSLAVSIGVSGNFHAAACLARGGCGRHGIALAEAGAERAALSALSVTVLDLSEEQAQTLRAWGIHTLGRLAELPEEALIARMGQEGKRLLQAARGELPHLFLAAEEDFLLEEQLELDEPVALLEPLLFLIGALLDRIIARAAAHLRVLAAVAITLQLEDGSAHTRRVQPALPSNDRRLWLRLLHLDLAEHPPQAAALCLKLAAQPGEGSKVQLGLLSPQTPEPGRLDVTLARLRAVVGGGRVGCPALKDTHRPEGFSVERFAFSGGPCSAPAPGGQRAALRWLRPAERVRMLGYEQRPDAFFFRGRKYVVKHAFGPWRMSGEWWGPGAWQLEQWDVIAGAVDGSLLRGRVSRDPAENGWQMVALYD